MIEYNSIQSMQICIVEYGGIEYFGVYHPDDAGKRLVFSANKKDLENIEDFSALSVEQVIKMMNESGFDLEPKENFEEVLYFESKPNNMFVKITGAKKEKTIKIKFPEDFLK